MENLSAMLGNVGTFFTEAIGWLGEVMDIISTNPILFTIVVAIPVAGVAIGYCSRLFKLN